MHRVRIEAQTALLADGVDALVLGVGVGQLHERIADLDMVVLVAAHEAGENDLARKPALFGQRRGLGLAMGEPVYVCGKDMEKNTVTVGPNEALFSSALRGNNWVWYPFPELTEPVKVTVKTRHSQTEQPGTIYPEADGFARVEFDIPQRAVAPGQAVVVYQGDLVGGGGTITEAIR